MAIPDDDAPVVVTGEKVSILPKLVFPILSDIWRRIPLVIHGRRSVLQSRGPVWGYVKNSIEQGYFQTSPLFAFSPPIMGKTMAAIPRAG